MTDIEKAKEIATKVWGWKTVKNPTLINLPEGTIIVIEPGSLPHLVNSYFEPDRLRDEVNSWAGFGRTVEAMADARIDEGYHVSINPNNEVRFYRGVGHEFNDIGLTHPANLNKRLIIKATHQAALDAVKENKA